MSSSSRVFVFRPKSAKDRAARAEALDALREQIRSLSDDDMPFRDKVEALQIVSRRRAAVTAESTFGAYTMIANFQVDRVWDAIATLPGIPRRKDVDRVFKKVLVNLVPGTGEVGLSRAALADATGLRPAEVSCALTVLVRLGVLRRELVPEEGLRGRGRAVFFINPHVGWNGPLELQAAAAVKRSPPLLKLLEASA